MSRNVIVFDRLLDGGHVASNTRTSGAVIRMMCVLADRPFEARRILLGVAR